MTKTRAGGVVVDRRGGTATPPFVGVGLGGSAAAARAPMVLEQQASHRDTTYGSHASGSCSSAAWTADAIASAGAAGAS